MVAAVRGIVVEDEGAEKRFGEEDGCANSSVSERRV
jgi:hypothetical protein